MEQVYTPKKNYKVLVNCMTYNQSKYIEDALNGFAMQKTDFPFVCLVMDDASTDGEQEVIKSWMERECDMEKAEYIDIELSNIILVPHMHNVNCVFAFYFLKRNLWKEQELKESLFIPWQKHCEYEALCEGDDYWINPRKLQKQYDFMQQHPNCMLCATNALTLWDEGKCAPAYFKAFYKTSIMPISEIIGNWLFATASLFIKAELMNDLPEWRKKLYFGDMTLILVASHLGEVGVISDLSAVYRKTEENKSSITVSLSKKMDYVKSQHILLYEEYDKWTNYQYHELIAPVINHCQKEKDFYYWRQKSRSLPFLTMPVYMIKKKLGLI